MDIYENSNQYSKIAKDYDSAGWDWVPNKWLNIIEKSSLIKRNQDIIITDLCCGTAKLLKGLTNMNSNPNSKFFGFDLNEDMMSASGRLDSRIKLKKANILDLEIDKSDVISCTYNSINYIDKINDLNLLINNIYKSLKEKGIFLFDFKPKNYYLNLKI